MASLPRNVGEAGISKRCSCQISARRSVLCFEGPRLGGRDRVPGDVGDFAHRRRRVSELLGECLGPVDATVGEIETFLLPELNRLFKQRNGPRYAARSEKCVAKAGERKRLVGDPPQGTLMELGRLGDESVMIPAISRMPGDAISLAIGRRGELQEMDVGEGIFDLSGGEACVDPRPAGTRRLRRPGERLIEEREAPPRFVGAVGGRLKQGAGERCERLCFRRMDVGRLRARAVPRFEGDVPLQRTEEPATEARRPLVEECERHFGAPACGGVDGTKPRNYAAMPGSAGEEAERFRPCAFPIASEQCVVDAGEIGAFFKDWDANQFGGRRRAVIGEAEGRDAPFRGES